MSLTWAIASLTCVLVLGSVCGRTVRDCDMGSYACNGTHVYSTDGQGNTMCCPEGFAMNNRVVSRNGVTTRKCICTQGTGSKSTLPEAVSSEEDTGPSSLWETKLNHLQQLLQDLHNIKVGLLHPPDVHSILGRFQRRRRSSPTEYDAN